MKIAVCFSGELRSIEHTFPLIKRYILDHLPSYDSFVHLWIDDTNIKKLPILIRNANIKDLLMEDRQTFDKTLYFNPLNIEMNHQAILRQLYCVQQVNNLKCLYEKDNSFIYDWVIRIRPDLLILEEYKFEISKLRNTNLYLLDHDHWHGYCDRFYFSNSKDMDILSNRIDRLKYYSNLGGSMQYEGFLKFVADYNDLSIKEISMKTCLLRENGDKAGEIIAIQNGDIEKIGDRWWHIKQNNFI